MQLERARVTVREFAALVRSGGYHDPANWGDFLPDPLEGGDKVLLRIGYSTARAGELVGSVSWFEANMFCRARGGRLPWRKELAQACISSGGEWCGEYDNQHNDSIAAPPEDPMRRKVHGWVRSGVIPSRFDAAVGFRIAYPED